MAAPTFAERRSTYSVEWDAMQVDAGMVSVIDLMVRARLENKDRYQAVEKATGVPWFFVACIHMREASGSFSGVLHNGERIIGTGRKTTLVPYGRGPFATWEDAAVDALSMRGLQTVKIDSIERFAYEAEGYNGWGYFYHSVPSAYLWSFSSTYKGGKYIADGVWSATAKDQQIGVMPFLKRMMAADPSISFAATPTPQPAPVPSPKPSPIPAPLPKPVPPKKSALEVFLELLLSFFTGRK